MRSDDDWGAWKFLRLVGADVTLDRREYAEKAVVLDSVATPIAAGVWHTISIELSR